MPNQAGSVNVRVAKQTHRQLAALAKENGLSMQTVIDRAIEVYRRNTFLVALNADFTRLQADSKAWVDELDERKLWEQTVTDGLE